MNERAVIMIRVSSDEQADPSKPSLQQQEDDARVLAERRGWEIVEVYREAGVSGAKPLDERHEVQRLLTDARQGRFEVIIVHKFDRFSRSVRTGLDLLSQLEDGLGLKVVSVQEDIDPDTAQGKFFRTQLMAFAEFERDMITERVIRGRHGKAAKGLVPGGAVAFGYRLEEGRLVEHPDEAPTVRLIFELAITGLSTYEIARELERRGIKSRHRSTFQHSNVRGWLLNPIYKGAGMGYRIKGVPYHFEASALVDEDTWNKARKVINRTARPNGRRKIHSYAASGRAFHEHEDGTRHLLYGMKRTFRRHRCTAALKRQQANPQGNGCPGLEGKGKRTSLRASDLEAYALTELLKVIGTPGAWAEYREAADRRAVAAKETEETAEAAQRHLADLDQEAARLVKLFQKGRMDESTFDTESADLDRKRAEAQLILDQAQADHEATLAVGVTIADLLNMEIHPPLPEDLADLDDIGEEQVVGWLHAETRRMRDGAETAPEAIVWLRSLMERFDATLVLGPAGVPRLELGAPVRAAA